MKDQDRTKEQLTDELVELRQRVAELEAADTERKRTEEALREAKELFEKTFTSQPDGIFILNARIPPQILEGISEDAQEALDVLLHTMLQAQSADRYQNMEIVEESIDVIMQMMLPYQSEKGSYQTVEDIEASLRHRIADFKEASK